MGCACGARDYDEGSVTRARQLDEVRLRPVQWADVPVLFGFQLDEASNEMAKVKPRDEATFHAVWERVFATPMIVARVITAKESPDTAERIVGNVSCFQRDGLDYVGYWIARDAWGRGYASRALALMLVEVRRRPLHARVAADNVASLKVLERCGFTELRRGWSPGDDRLVACDEVLLVLT